MTERSRFWNSPSVGDSSEAPYDAPTEYAAVTASMLNLDRLSYRSGVLLGSLSEYLPIIGAAQVTVASGRAFVNGTWHESDLPVIVAIPTPTVSTRQDKIVLRKDWALQTVRITRIAGVEGGGLPPQVNTVGLQWDFPLFNLTVTTAGVITVQAGQGRLIYPYPNYVVPEAYVYSNAIQSIPNAGARVIWNAGTNLVDAIWAAASPTRFTIVRSGLYQVEAFLNFSANPAGIRGIAVLKNGEAYSATAISQVEFAATATAMRINVSLSYSLTEGDYIEIFAYQNTGVALDLAPIVHADLPFSRARVRLLRPTGVL